MGVLLSGCVASTESYRSSDTPSRLQLQTYRKIEQQLSRAASGFQSRMIMIIQHVKVISMADTIAVYADMTSTLLSVEQNPKTNLVSLSDGAFLTGTRVLCAWQQHIRPE